MVNFHGMGMPSFDFDGVNSLSTYHIRLTAKPSIPTPQQRSEKFTVGGRDSFLTFTDGTYENITISVPVRTRVLERNVGTHFQNIRDWLMRKNFRGDGPSLVFSHFPEVVYEVYEWKPYTWDYYPPTGEYFTTFEIECRPYKKSTITDTVVIDNVGAPVMSPWTIFRADEKDQFGNNLYEAGYYWGFDGDNIDMMEDYGLVTGWQNANNQVDRLRNIDGSGVSVTCYDAKGNDRANRNCLYQFFDVSQSASRNGQWTYYPNTKVIVESGKDLTCYPSTDGLRTAVSNQSPDSIKLWTAGDNNSTYYINFDTSTPTNVSVSVYEVDYNFKRIKTLVASGKNGAQFSLMNMQDISKNYIQFSIEFNNTSSNANIQNVRITRTNGAPYNPTFASYGTTHVKANLIEMAKKLDMFVFNNSDADDVKLKAIQDRLPEIEWNVTNVNPSGAKIAASQVVQVGRRNPSGDNRLMKYWVSNVTDAGTRSQSFNALKPVTTQLTTTTATSEDNRLHLVNRFKLTESNPAQTPYSFMTDEVYIRMRMMVRPTTVRQYDNSGGEEAPIMISTVVKGGKATLEWRDAFGGVFQKFTLALPTAYWNKDIMIDTDKKRVWDSATGQSLTQYAFGVFPRCIKGARMEYRINEDVLRASLEITKRKL